MSENERDAVALQHAAAWREIGAAWDEINAEWQRLNVAHTRQHEDRHE